MWRQPKVGRTEVSKTPPKTCTPLYRTISQTLQSLESISHPIDYIIQEPAMPSSSPCTAGVGVQCSMYQAGVVHPDYLSNPPELCPHDECLDVRHAIPAKHFSVGYSVYPRASKTSVLSYLDSSFLKVTLKITENRCNSHI